MLNKIFITVWGIIISILLTCFAIDVFASTVIIYNNSSDEIYSLSSKDDTIVPAGYSKAIIKDNISDLELSANPIYYKYKNGKFIKNIDKISKEEQAKEDKIKADKKKEEDKIKAIDKLKTLGLTNDEINALVK